MRTVGDSNIKRRQFAKKYASKTPETSPPETPKPTEPIIRQNKPSPNTTVQTSEIADRKKSTDLLDNEIKLDAEGRYDLDQVKDRNVIEQFAMGLPVTTEQIIQMPKDVIEGVHVEDQAMKESGLDLLLTPLITPIAGQKELGITDKDWYWPEEVNQAVGILPIKQESLPPFLRRGGGSSMNVVEGISHNISLFGEVASHPEVGRMRDEEFARSGERFMTAPAYYIGTAVGEIPYWFVGVGEAKLVASVGSKAAAIAVVSAAKTGKIPKIAKIAHMIKAEKAHYGLQKALIKERQVAGSMLVGSKKGNFMILASLTPKVKNAIKVLKKDDANAVKIQLDEQTSHIKDLEKRQNDLNKKITAEKDSAEKKILRTERDEVKTNIDDAKKRFEDIKKMSSATRISKLETQLDVLKKNVDNKPTAENRLRYTQFVEEEIAPLMKKKYDDVKLTSENIMRMRREALVEKKAKINQKISQARKSIDPKVQKKITSYETELKDIQYKLDYHENIRIDELLKSIRSAPETIPRRITKRFEKRATTPGDDTIEDFFKNTMDVKLEKGDYEGATGSLRFVKDWYEGGISKMKNREVQYWTDVLSSKVPKINVLTSAQMKQVRKNLSSKKQELRKNLVAEMQAEGVDITRVLKRSIVGKSSDISIPLKKIYPNISPDKLDHIIGLESQIKKIDYVLDNDSRFSYKIPGSKKSYMEFELIKRLSPELYESVRPKEIIFTTRPAVKAHKTHGAIVAEVQGTGWEAMIFPKKQPTKSKFRRRITPGVPNPLKRLTDDNAEIMFYSRREIAGPVDPNPVFGTDSKIAEIVRVPKRLDESAKDILRRQGYMRPLKESDVPLPMEGLPGDMELWEMIPITKFQRESNLKVFTGKRDSILTAEADAKFTTEHIEAFRDLLKNKHDEYWYQNRDADMAKVIGSVKKEISKLEDKKILSKEGKNELKFLKKELNEAETKRLRYAEAVEKLKDTRKTMADLNVTPYGIPRGTIFHMANAKTFTRSPEINMSNIIEDTMTKKRYVMIDGTDNPTGMFEVLDDKFFDLYRELSGAKPITEYHKVITAGDKTGDYYVEKKKFVDDSKITNDIKSEAIRQFVDEEIIDLNKVVGGDKRWDDVVRVVTPEDIDEMNRNTNLGRIETRIQKSIDGVDQSETIVKQGDAGQNVSTKSKRKMLTDTLKIHTFVKGRKTVQNIRSLFEKDRFRMVPRVKMTPHSDFVDQMMNEGVSMAIPENNIIARILSASNSVLKQGDETSMLPMNVQPVEAAMKELDGVKVYGIYDTQIVSGAIPDDFMGRALSDVMDDHGKFNKFKASKDKSDIETLKNILETANDDEKLAIKKNIIRHYKRNVKGEKPTDQSKFEIDVNEYLDDDGKKFNALMTHIEQKNLFRTPTKKEKAAYWKNKKSKKSKETIERSTGIINPNKAVKELSHLFSDSDVKRIPGKIRSYLLGKLVMNDAMFTEPGKHTLLTSGLSKLVYGVNKKRMIGLVQNPGVRKGYIEAIEFKRDHGLKVSRGEARIYNVFKGRNLTDMQGAMVRQGVNVSGIRSELDVGNVGIKVDPDTGKHTYTPAWRAQKTIDDVRWAQKMILEEMDDAKLREEQKMSTADAIQKEKPTKKMVGDFDKYNLHASNKGAEFESFTPREWFTFNPFKGSLETMDYDLAAVKTKEILLKEWGVSEDAYKTSAEMLKELEIRRFIGKEMKDAQQVMADKSSTPQQVFKAGEKLKSSAKRMEESQARVSAISQAMQSQKTSSLQKQVTPGKPANPAELPERILSFSMEEFVPQQVESGWTPGHLTSPLGTQPQTILPQAYAEEQKSTTVTPQKETVKPDTIQKDIQRFGQSISSGTILNNIQSTGTRAAAITGIGSLLGANAITAAAETTAAATTTSLKITPVQGLILKTKQMQSEVFRTGTADAPRAHVPTEQRLFPVDQIHPYHIYTPRRLFPPIIALPQSGFERAQEKRRRRKVKSKKKKQWWQTPEWWYQPYYWGGKDQMGAGYTTFTGKEPSKVKRYEKEFFGGF